MSPNGQLVVATLLGGAAGMVIGVVLLFGVALGVQAAAPFDTTPEFYLAGAPAGAVAGAVVAFVRCRNRGRKSETQAGPG